MMACDPQEECNRIINVRFTIYIEFAYILIIEDSRCVCHAFGGVSA